MRRLRGITRLASWLMLLPAAAHAQELQWRTPDAAGCATRSEIEARVHRLGERRLRATGPARIVAELEHSDGRWHARVRVLGVAASARELPGRPGDCRSLDVAVAIVIATVLEGLPEPRPPVAHDRYRLAGALTLAMGLAPDPLIGAQLRMALPFWVDADVNAYLPERELDAHGQGARLWAWHAGLSFCPRTRTGLFELQLCGGGELGAIHAQGVGLVPPRSAARLLALLGVEPELGVRVTTGLQIAASLMGAWLPARPRFAFGLSDGVLHDVQSDRFAWLLRIGVIGFLP